MSTRLADKVPTQSRLWLKWDKAVHLGNGEVRLDNPVFYGPVLADCEPIEEAGEIKLDLTSHYLILILDPYMITLRWEGKVSQTTLEVKFKTMFLKDGAFGKLSLLQDDDQILMDCTGQTTEARAQNQFKMAYDAIVFNSLKQPYDFSKY
jgi:hypothetical protein